MCVLIYYNNNRHHAGLLPIQSSIISVKPWQPEEEYNVKATQTTGPSQTHATQREHKFQLSKTYGTQTLSSPAFSAAFTDSLLILNWRLASMHEDNNWQIRWREMNNTILCGNKTTQHINMCMNQFWATAKITKRIKWYIYEKLILLSRWERHNKLSINSKLSKQIQCRNLQNGDSLSCECFRT